MRLLPGSPRSTVSGSRASPGRAGSALAAARSRRGGRRRPASCSGASPRPGRAGLVVPVAVTPALLLGMREPAVKLDGELVLLVVRVPVDHLAVDDDAYLMPGSRQAVGALDVAQVPVFQD